MELKSFEIFVDLSEDVLGKLLKITEEKKAPAGTVIFEEGAVSDVFYLVQKGRVEIFKRLSGGETKTLAILEPGSQFGEMSLFEDKQRMASVRAAEDTVLLGIKREKFARLLVEDVEAGLKIISAIMSVIMRRLSVTNNHLTLLYNTGKLIAAAKELPAMITSVFANTKDVFREFDRGMIAVYNKFTDEFDVQSSIGIEPRVSTVAKDDAIALLLASRRELLITDAGREFHELAGHPAAGRSLVASAFFFEDKFTGFILFSSGKPSVFCHDDLILLSSVSSLVSVAINNLTLIADEQGRERLRETRYRQEF
jgi:CRP-like cAMP-binding protein